MSTSVIDPTVLERTRSTLGKVIKLDLTDDLLSKPTFSFLVEIIKKVTKKGFYEELFTSFDIQSISSKDSSMKISFLEKAIDALSFTIGKIVDVRAEHMLEGIEPEKTNEFLYLLGNAIMKNVSSRLAVQKVLNGENPQKILPIERSMLYSHENYRSGSFLLHITSNICGEETQIRWDQSGKEMILGCLKLNIGIPVSDLRKDLHSVLRASGVHAQIGSCWCEPKNPIFEMIFYSKESVRQFILSTKGVGKQFISAVAERFQKEAEKSPHFLADKPIVTEIVKFELLMATPDPASSRKVVVVTEENCQECMQNWLSNTVYPFSELLNMRSSVLIPYTELSTLVFELKDVVNWSKFGLMLKLPKSDLDRIQINYAADNYMMEAVDMWLKREEKPTWDMVVEALEKIDERNLARKIAQKYGVPISRSDAVDYETESQIISHKLKESIANKHEEEVSLCKLLKQQILAKDTLQEECKSQEKQISDLRRRVTKLETDKKNLKKRLSEHGKVSDGNSIIILTELHKQLHEKEKELSKEKETCTLVQKKYNKVKVKLKEKELYVRSLQESQEKLNQDLAEEKYKLSLLDLKSKNIDDLKKEIDKLHIERDELNRHLGELKEKVRRTEEEIIGGGLEALEPSVQHHANESQVNEVDIPIPQEAKVVSPTSKVCISSQLLTGASSSTCSSSKSASQNTKVISAITAYEAAVNSKGDLWVITDSPNEVTVVKSEGDRDKLRPSFSDDSPLVSIAIDQDDHAFLATKKSLLEFNTITRKLLRHQYIVSSSIKNDVNPKTISVSSSQIYIINESSSRILILQRKDMKLLRYMQCESEPLDIAVQNNQDPLKTTIYIALHPHIQVVNTNGESIHQIPYETELLRVNLILEPLPMSICVFNDYLYIGVCNTPPYLSKSFISVYQIESRKYVRPLVRRSKHLKRLCSITIGSNQKLYVCNQTGLVPDTIYVFTI